jgi:hypothetical protein
MAAYVVRGERADSPDFERVAQGLFTKLAAGSARIGWSYADNLDLGRIIEETDDGIDGAPMGVVRHQLAIHGGLSVERLTSARTTIQDRRNSIEPRGST